MWVAMSTTLALLERIESHCHRRGMSVSTFGKLAVNDGKLVSRLRMGASITLKTLEKIELVLNQSASDEPQTSQEAAA